MRIKKYIQIKVGGREIIITVIFFLLLLLLQNALPPNLILKMYNIEVVNQKIKHIAIQNWIMHIFVSIVFSGLLSLMLFAFLEVFSRFPEKWKDFQKHSLRPISTIIGVSTSLSTEWYLFTYLLNQVKDKKSFILEDVNVSEYVKLLSKILRV